MKLAFPTVKTLWRWFIRIVVGYFGFSFILVLAYALLPVPFTLTMIPDALNGNGITKSWTPLSQISPNMARAAIAGEDEKFCSHHGFDWDAMQAAWRADENGHRIRGGSTISQQTAKNVFLWQGGGLFRKGLEAYFTFLIEHIWGKRRIMEVYLNVAETGIGTYGAQAGAERYFGHSAANLSPTEAARIAAVLPLPKHREAIDPTGFVRRHGNRIAGLIGVVRRDGLDRCLY
ncbi:MAG: monofunctional biosynthetic peptidoglycan transglycosylase [Alphaproteobacteria bacterium]|nr:monofunctional biosynthetic peptidoglycan transglycosylase [Alphaproteobacteria bacterium]